MKILFHAYNCCCQNEGGGVQVRIRRLQELLTSKGIQVDFFNPYETKVRDYDVLHIFMLSLENQNLVNFAKSLKLKTVLSSIVSIENGRAIDFYRRLPRPFTSEIKMNYNFAHKFDTIITETPAEADFLNRHYNIEKSKMRVIPNGVDVPCEKSDEIYEIIGGRKKYALLVGRFDTNKNQLNVINALKGADYDLVFIGGTGIAGDTAYYDSCLKAANNNPKVHFLGWLPSDSSVLHSAYQNAHAVIFPSHHETFGLVATEGAVSGAHVCISNTLAINGYNVFKKEHTFNPDNLNEIRRVVDIVMNTPKNDSLKKRAMEVFSWDSIAQQHIDIYNG